MAMAAVSMGPNIQASDVRLGRLLQEHGLINDYQLFDALQAQAANGGRLGPLLVKRGCLSNQQLHNMLEVKHEHLHAAFNTNFSLAPVPADRVSLPGAVSMCLSLTVPDGMDCTAFPVDGYFATMPLLLPAETSDWLVTAHGRHSVDRFELISEDQVPLEYDLAIRLCESQDLFPLVAGGASALHMDTRPAPSKPAHAVVEACIPAEAFREAKVGHYVEFIDLAITHSESDFLG